MCINHSVMYAMTSLKENPEIIKPGGRSAVLATDIKVFICQIKTQHFLIKIRKRTGLIPREAT